MTIDQLVTAILILCGPNENCWHYYNNCVNHLDIKMERVLECKDERNKKEALSKLPTK